MLRHSLHFMMLYLFPHIPLSQLSRTHTTTADTDLSFHPLQHDILPSMLSPPLHLLLLLGMIILPIRYTLLHQSHGSHHSRTQLSRRARDMEPGGLHGTKLFIGATSSSGHDGTGMSCECFLGCVVERKRESGR